VLLAFVEAGALEEQKGLTPARDRRRFTAIPQHGTVDYLLRTVQQGLVHFSSMADAKANIVITVSALVFTIGLTRVGDPELSLPILALLAGAIGALVLAILCVLPGRYVPIDARRGNPLFFLHYGSTPVDDYLDRMDELLSDLPAVYDAILRDIHGQGAALARRKYRLLRWSYGALLAGFATAALLALVQLAEA
jgi:hypothetical protein